MLFSAGLGVGLLFYGVAEPVLHYSSDALHEGEASFSDKANLAMNLSYLHWGFHGWAIYGIVGLCFAYFTYNFTGCKRFYWIIHTILIHI